jgi:hypothetical protein
MALRLRPATFDVIATLDSVVSHLARKDIAFSRRDQADPVTPVSCTRPVPVRLATPAGRISSEDSTWGWSILMIGEEERWLADLRDVPAGPALNRVRSGGPVRRFEVSCAMAEAEGLRGFVEILRIPELAVESLRVSGPPVRYVIPDANDPDRAIVMTGRDFRTWLRSRQAARLSAVTSPGPTSDHPSFESGTGGGG